MADLTELVAAAVGGARDAEQVEAYTQESRRTQVRVRNQEVESFVFAESRGMGVRLISDGRVGYSYAADPDAAEVPDLVERARESARFAEPDEANVLPMLEAPEPLDGIFRPAHLDATTERKVALAMELEQVATSAHPDARKVEDAAYGDAVSRVALASTNGGPFDYERTDCWAAVSSLAQRADETQTGFAYRIGREIDELDWRAAATEAAERGARLLGSSKPATARVPVVLDPVAATGFLGVLVGALSAESVLKGRSLLAGREGSQVGSELVTLVDDGRLLEGPAASPFDDEGVATQRTPLLEGGTLRSFLHNTYTATRAGATSTGNAGRAGYRSVPGVGPSNLHVEPGDDPIDELLRRAEGGVFIQDVTGLHSGANPVSGEFSVGAVGLRIRDGALGEPLREMTIASTLLDVLTGIAAVGSDLRFFGGGLGSPSILVGEMTVGGI